MDIIKCVAEYAGYIITIITLITLLSKNLRSALLSFINHKINDDKSKEQFNDLLNAISEIKAEVGDIKVEMQRQRDEDIKESEAIKCSLRNTITHLYYKYKLIGSIPALERENLTFLFNAYKSLGGNSYVNQCYDELMDLQVIN